MQRSTSSSANAITNNQSYVTTRNTSSLSSNNNNNSSSTMKSSLFGGGPRKGGFGAHSTNTNTNSNTNGGNNNNNNNNHTDTYRMEIEEDARRENDRQLTGLGDDLSRLRREAEFLRGEVASQNELLDSVQNFMIGARDGIVGSVNKLDSTMKRYGVKHTIMFALAMCGAFFVAVYLIKGMLFGQGGGTASSGVPHPSSTQGGMKEVAAMAHQAAKILAKDEAVNAPPLVLPD